MKTFLAAFGLAFFFNCTVDYAQGVHIAYGINASLALLVGVVWVLMDEV